MGCSRLAALANINADDNQANDVYAPKKEYTKEEIVERDMFSALKRDQFKVYYQTLHEPNSGKIVGAEALTRWDHPELGLLMPNDFIPKFEENGFVKKLDAYVRERVCSDIERWRMKGYKLVPISINLSRMDFEDDNLIDSIFDLTHKYNISHDLLIFEITETANINNDGVLRLAVSRLRDNGFKIGLDDFGSGYSSFSMLNEVALDALKIDKSLIEKQNGANNYLLDTCIKLSQQYELETEVEGVETREQLDLARNLNCNAVQGFYFSQAMPVEVFELRLAAN